MEIIALVRDEFIKAINPKWPKWKHKVTQNRRYIWRDDQELVIEKYSTFSNTHHIDFKTETVDTGGNCWRFLEVMGVYNKKKMLAWIKINHQGEEIG